jgi:hypothetical protein
VILPHGLDTPSDASSELELAGSAADDLQSSSKLNVRVPHSARVWNYWLGGKDNFPVDRKVGDKICEVFPDMALTARADRAFLCRAVRYLAGEARVDQFLDIGTGLPTVDNTHEVAQRVAPQSRIVYVDNDPLVLAHARALLTSSPQGVTDYLDADLHEPDTIIAGAAKTLDLTRPVAVMLLGIVHFILDDDEAQVIVRRLVDAVPPGSYLVINHATTEVTPEATSAGIAQWNQFGEPKMTARSPRQIADFLQGLELLQPGVVSCSRWRPDPSPHGEPAEVDEFCAVGRKPDTRSSPDSGA